MQPVLCDLYTTYTMKKLVYSALVALALAGSVACVREASDENDDAQEKATKEQADEEKDHTLSTPNTH